MTESIDWRYDSESLAQALEHVLLEEIGAVRGDGHPAWVPLEAHEQRVKDSGGYKAAKAGVT